MRYFLLVFVVVIVFNACADEANAANNDFTDGDLKDEVASWNSDPAESEGRTGPIADWDVQRVTDMYSMFGGSKHNYPSTPAPVKRFNGAIASWDVGEVTNMYNMFFGA